MGRTQEEAFREFQHHYVGDLGTMDEADQRLIYEYYRGGISIDTAIMVATSDKAAGGKPSQPKTDTADLSAAIEEFERSLPGWWWSVCVCSLTRDASCAPDVRGPDGDLCDIEEFDKGFHRDDPNGTLASSLRDVMRQGLEARDRFRNAKRT